ncbi:MAG: hypothetical protein ACI9G1_000549, partial [Pirellulaceae bacterium]
NGQLDAKPTVQTPHKAHANKQDCVHASRAPNRGVFASWSRNVVSLKNNGELLGVYPSGDQQLILSLCKEGRNRSRKTEKLSRDGIIFHFEL